MCVCACVRMCTYEQEIRTQLGKRAGEKKKTCVIY